MNASDHHSLLRRQLKRCFGPDGQLPPGLEGFIDAVDAAYREFDNDRAMLERALELSSQELLQAGAEMRAVFKAIPDLLIRIDAADDILDCKMGSVGDSSAPLPGDLRRVVAPAHVAAFAMVARDVRLTKKIIATEYVLGEPRRARHYEARVVPVMDGQVAAFVRDISARKRAETLRVGQNRVLEMIGNGLPLPDILAAVVNWVEQLVPGVRTAVFLADTDGTTLRPGAAPRVPPEFLAVLAALPPAQDAAAGGNAARRRRIEAVGDVLSEPAWAPLHVVCEQHHIRAAVSAPIVSSQQVLLGTVALYFSEQLQPAMEELDLLLLATHIAAIAIERQRHDEELRRTVSLVTSTLESTADGILVVDNSGRIVRFNERFATLWRIPPEILASRDDGVVLRHAVSQLKHPEAFLARVNELYASQQPESFEVVEFKDGRIFERYSCLHRLDGRPIGRVWNFRDVTERVHLEEQFRHAQKMDAVGRLAGGVAHDFNNLLTVIMGNLSMVRSARLTPTQQQAAVADCIEATHRAANLTGQLLTFSRRQPIATQEIDLNRLVTNMASMLRRLIGEHINLNSRIAPVPAWVRADHGMVEQMLMNLALNGRDAMPRGGELTIVVTPVDLDEPAVRGRAKARPGSFVRLSVTDTGTGIDPELLPRIFEPFFTTKEVGHGTGLGLATVFGIVEQHEGWIEVESEQRRGTTMAVFLPRLATPAGEPAGRKPTAQPRGGSESILVVEDENAVRMLMQKVLQTHGYRVHAARNAQEALTLWAAQKGQFDLLITDIIMPGGINGRELAQKLRAESPQLSIVYCSGYTDEVLGGAAPLRGSSNFLEKPFDIEVFLNRVRSCLDHRTPLPPS